MRVAGEPNGLRPTANHPFFIKHREDGEGHWVNAAALQVGDSVLTAKGAWSAVTTVSSVEREEIVYNFEVADNHGYFVGASGILVHNDCVLFHGTTADAAGAILRDGLRAGADEAVFFAEDYATAAHFAQEAAAEAGGSAGRQVLGYVVQDDLAGSLGLAERELLGEFRGAPPIDIPGGSGFERILSGSNVSLFNQAVISGEILVKAFRIF